MRCLNNLVYLQKLQVLLVIKAQEEKVERVKVKRQHNKAMLRIHRNLSINRNFRYKEKVS
jgi:hypothetical protein